MQSRGLEAAATRLFRAQAKGRKKDIQVNFNQVSVIGFLGKAPKTSAYLHKSAYLGFGPVG